MRETAARDPRMLDGLINQMLSQTPLFFSLASILVIGALLALLGIADRAAKTMLDIPFAQSTTSVVLELKMLVLMGISPMLTARQRW